MVPVTIIRYAHTHTHQIANQPNNQIFGQFCCMAKRGIPEEHLNFYSSSEALIIGLWSKVMVKNRFPELYFPWISKMLLIWSNIEIKSDFLAVPHLQILYISETFCWLRNTPAGTGLVRFPNCHECLPVTSGLGNLTCTGPVVAHGNVKSSFKALGSVFQW